MSCQCGIRKIVAMSGIWVVALLSFIAEAHPYTDAAVPSTVARIAAAVIPPLPTVMPKVQELLRRQAVTSSTSYEVWDAKGPTCGYLSGTPGAALSCGGLSTCMFLPHLRAQWCCGLTDCEAYLSCLDAVSVADPQICDDVCHQDEFMLKW